MVALWLYHPLHMWLTQPHSRYKQQPRRSELRILCTTFIHYCDTKASTMYPGRCAVHLSVHNTVLQLFGATSERAMHVNHNTYLKRTPPRMGRPKRPPGWNWMCDQWTDNGGQFKKNNKNECRPSRSWRKSPSVVPKTERVSRLGNSISLQVDWIYEIHWAKLAQFSAELAKVCTFFLSRLI